MVIESTSKVGQKVYWMATYEDGSWLVTGGTIELHNEEYGLAQARTPAGLQWVNLNRDHTTFSIDKLCEYVCDVRESIMRTATEKCKAISAQLDAVMAFDHKGTKTT